MADCFTVDGVRIAFDDVGSGPPLVLVHGITDNRSLWGPIVDRLKDEYRCVTLDLRGHGDSGDAVDYSALAMATDVGAVVAALGLTEAPRLVGHSLGGVVVTVYAAGAAAAAVVNVDQSLRFGDFAAALTPLEGALRGDGFPEALTAIFASMQGDRLDEATTRLLMSHREHARQDVVLGVWDLVFSTPAADLDALVAQLGPAIEAPYLALHGLPLALGYVEWLHGIIPGAVIEEWPGDGHYLHLVDPDRFVARLRTFFASA